MTKFNSRLRSASALAIAVAGLGLAPHAQAQAVPDAAPQVPATTQGPPPQSDPTVPSQADGTVSQAPANPDAAAETEAADIVVTGTSIRGVAPVGSQLVQVDQAQIRASGVQSTAQLLATVPQLNSFGSTPRPTGGGSNPATAPSLRGLPSTATLSLVNGHRIVGLGTIGTVADPTSIPFAAIERVEVLTDGASSTYGSDAVAGVINFILRSDLDGVDALATHSFADGYQQTNISFVSGKKWSTGSYLFGAQYNTNSSLLGDERSFFTNNFTPFGGSDARSQQNAPPNVVVGSQAFAYNGTGFTPGASLYDNAKDTSIIPPSDRISLIANVKQDIGDSVHLFGDANYGHVETTVYNQQATANFTITNANPFFQSPVAGATSEDVLYSFRRELGRFRRDIQRLDYYGVSGGADIDISDRWHGRVFGNYGHSDTVVRQEGINLTALTEAAAGTTTATAFDPFNLRTSAATLASITDYINSPGSTQKLYQAVGTVDGRLFTLPGGDVRVAVGGEYRRETYDGVNATGRASAPTIVTTSGRRTVKSAYGELFVPILSEDNNVPGIYKLSVTAALRYDDYNDFGDTTNPKFGAEWQPFRGLTLRGNYSKSFHAPSLADLNAIDTRAERFVGYSPDFFTPITPNRQYNVLYLAGGNPNLGPERAKTYSFGADFKPVFVPGLRLSGTYFNIKYKGLINIAGSAFSTPSLSQFYTLNPTEQQITDAIGNIRIEGSRFPAGTTDVLIDLRRNNVGAQNVSGIDFDANYNRSIASLGSVRAGVSGTKFITNESQAAPGAVFVNTLDRAFPKWRIRGTGGFETGPVNANVFVNYTSKFNNITATPTQRVESYTTVDATLNIALGTFGAPNGGIDLQLAVFNIFDKDVPQLLSGDGLTVPNQSTYASPIGRLGQVGVRFRF